MKKHLKPNKKKLNLKQLYLILGYSFLSIITLIGIIVGTFGLGFQSLQFKNKISSIIKKSIDSHLVIDSSKVGDDQLESSLIFAVIKTAYIIDAVSTLSSNQYSSLGEKYIAIAEETFENDYIASGIFSTPSFINTRLFKDLPLKKLGQKLLLFDFKVGQKYVTPLTEIGLEWTATPKGLKNLMTPNYKSTDFYKYVTQINDQMPQKEYNQIADKWIGIDYKNENPAEVEASIIKLLEDLLDPNVFILNNKEGAPGIHIINNKIWFTNFQFILIKTLFLGPDVISNFLSDTNAEWYNNLRPDAATGKTDRTDQALTPLNDDDLGTTSYLQAYFQARVGAYWNTVVTPLVALITIPLLITFTLRFNCNIEEKKWVKRKSKKENKSIIQKKE